ncbi:sigma-70 family RNA polymerase sigma factor [uncultured Draconibacterium sp.]|uniref:RNA polymerase sigma factor n=1 Tax=uncultured Draconibacterium sp. TaxID=1573823 RepID=UPI002AA61E71|nr:sigma-70 family RNA polymerase sigma factor [uncultured Draconibacterium sp.]
MSNKTDKKIWDDFRNGDDYALSHIYYQYVQDLFRYGKKFFDDDELIKDMIQALFFDLIRTRKSLGSTENIRFYLISSFRNKLALVAKKGKFFERPTEANMMKADIVYSIEKEMIEEEQLSENKRLVQDALKELSPRQREILYYKYTCDFSYEQICEVMSLKYDSARKQVFRALRSLRKALGDKGSVLLLLAFSSQKNIFSKNN